MFERTALNLLSPAGRRARLMVFPYHRVLQSADPMSPESPTAERFERYLQRITRYCTPLLLSEAVERLKTNSLPARAVALTFDDGYANNLEVAAPLLKKHGVPATVFVAVDAMQRGIMWNDLLIEAARGATGELNASALGLGRIDLATADRKALSKELIGTAQYLPTEERLEKCEQLFADTGLGEPPRLMLEPERLEQFAQYGIEVGAHTVNHPILKNLDATTARAEIAGSADWIEQQIGERPTLFAYPNGKRGFDYDAREVELVRDLGFQAAVAADWGCATPTSPLFELPRFKPWEDSDVGFARRLCKVVTKTYL